MKSDEVPDLICEVWREKIRLTPLFYLRPSAEPSNILFNFLFLSFFLVNRVQMMNWNDLDKVISQSDASIQVQNLEVKNSSKKKIN